MFNHEDAFSGIEHPGTLNERLEVIHKTVREEFPWIHRIAVALHDAKMDTLKTFVASSGKDRPLTRYECPMSQAPSLQEICRSRRPRVVNDLSIFNDGKHEHTQKIEQQGYGSSYTVPVFSRNAFWGFIFFNSYRKNCFRPEFLRELDLIAHLVTNIVIQELASTRVLLAALKSAGEMVHERDPETGVHLDRMSRFSRIIAQHLAETGRYAFTDEFIEWIFLFSPLHDIGKIGIPDEVLRKAAPLNGEEFRVMKSHTTIGMKIVNAMIDNFGFHSLEGIEVLRNITGFHHEKVNGTGYPMGLKGDEIPPEARVVAVADIFDALTSHRPYKRAWSNEEALQMLLQMSATEVDRDCVEALLLNQHKIESIQAQFLEPLQTSLPVQ